MKELNIDLNFDDLVVTQIICKTCKLFALANMASYFITEVESVTFLVKSSMHDRAVTASAVNDRKARNKPSDIGRDYRKWI